MHRVSALRHLALTLLSISLVIGLPAAVPHTSAQSATPSPVTTPAYDPADLLAIKPDLREEVAAALPAGLTVYDIELAFPKDGQSRTLKGVQDVVYTNTTGETLTTLPFRLYANSASAGHNALTIDRAFVDNTVTTVALTVDNSVATLTLPEPLAPGEETRVSMEFTSRPDQDDPRHYGIYNLATTSGTWSLAHWYPVVAGRDPQTGWMLQPTSVFGDPIFTDTGLYSVTVTAPDNLGFMTSGVETGSDSRQGMTTTTFNAWPSRDFVLVADADMVPVSRIVDGTTISSWHEPLHQAAAEAALTWSTRALQQFNTLLGEYPYLQLHVAEIEIYNAAGVEFPQLFTVDEGYYRKDPNLQEPGHFEFTVAHEVVHQWFYNLVGNNQYDSAFIDESLTNYLSARVYFEKFHGKETADEVVLAYLGRPFQKSVESGNDPIVDFPTDDYPTQGSYVIAAYSKGALGFAEIHKAMGDDAFFEALRAYVQAFSFRVATPQDLLAAFERASATEIEPIWTHWFEARNGALDARRHALQFRRSNPEEIELTA